MHCNFRLKASVFYGIIVMGIIFTVFVFAFSSRGFASLDSKRELLEIKRQKIEELSRRKTQLSINIDRLENDKEYILSYAKTFGYLDGSKNEKIIKILRKEDVEDANTSISSKDDKYYSTGDGSNIRDKWLIILALTVGICIVFYILISRNIPLKKTNHS